MKKIKRIGILTSGGDAPGMNACIRSTVKFALHQGIKPFFIYNGYLGLYRNNIKEAKRADVGDIINRGGTIIKSSRFPEFNKLEIRQVAVKNLQEHKIDALITLGGDGTFIGAKNMSEMGINCVGIPCTIDNDLPYTKRTLGFDTALNTIMHAGDNLRDTASSHHQCSILEVMGNECGDLAVFSAFNLGPEMVITKNTYLETSEIIKNIKAEFKRGKQHVLIIVSENLYNVISLAKICESETKERTRATILGHVQRGGSPSSYDRYYGTRLGIYAVKLLEEQKSSICIGTDGDKLIYRDIIEASKMARPSRINIINEINYTR